jgi:DNA polymerase I
MVGLTDLVDSRTELHVMNVEYTEQFGEPIVHLFCRDKDNKFHWVEVEGHRPKFYIRPDDYDDRLQNHNWVEGVSGGFQTIHGEDLVTVETGLPKHVGGDRETEGLREYFDTTWEADVFYGTRFLIDTGIKTHFSVDMDDVERGQRFDGDYRAHVDDIQAVEDPEWKAEPRTVTVDIEVETKGVFPDASEARNRVTAITAHSSDDGRYRVWVLDAGHTTPNREELHESTDVPIAECSVHTGEADMLESFNEWVATKRPDMLSGWNSSTVDNGSPFDYPYLINRCDNLNVTSHHDWSPMGRVWDGSWGPDGKGVQFFDMMQAYTKTRWNEPKGGYGLDNIAELELGRGKDDVEDLDAAWKERPTEFLRYNVRDVEAVVEIDRESGTTDLYQNLRRLAGVQFDQCHNNIDLLDVYILRFAHERGIALPTNEEPDRGWFHGGYNFIPEFGRHENTVYPDVWSEYPNAFRTCNMSPETIIGTKEDLAASEYTEEDCRWSYIDTRPTSVKRESDPVYEKCYYLKPEIKEGFMNEVVDHVMGLKDQYDGTELYGPVKQIVNSTWGVYGDSNSYGKGYRLFDWRVAESITLYGRTVIQGTAEKFVDEVNTIKDEWGFEGQNAYIVGGDTDSCMASIPFTQDSDYHSLNHDPDHLATIQVAHEAVDRVNEWYDEFAAEQFNSNGEYIELELESFADRTYVPEPATAAAEGKKRYCELTRWDEGTWYDPPEFSVTGIDVVRSDRAAITREVVGDVLELILRVDDIDEARQRVYERISEAVEAVETGEISNAKLGRPRGMGQPPEEYGSPSKTPMPTYRGAKYANEHFPWADIGAGSKPVLFYIERVRGDWPQTYTADTREDGEPVDAVALENPEKLPPEFIIDSEKMVEKTLRDSIEPMLSPLHWSFDDALADTEQSDISTFF